MYLPVILFQPRSWALIFIPLHYLLKMLLINNTSDFTTTHLLVMYQGTELGLPKDRAGPIFSVSLFLLFPFKCSQWSITLYDSTSLLLIFSISLTFLPKQYLYHSYSMSLSLPPPHAATLKQFPLKITSICMALHFCLSTAPN